MKQQTCTTCGTTLACVFLGLYIPSESKVYKLITKVFGKSVKVEKVPLSYCASCINDMQVKIGINEARLRHVKNPASSAKVTEEWHPSGEDVHYDSSKLRPINSIVEMSDDIKKVLNREQNITMGFYDVQSGMFVVLKESYCKGDVVLQGVTPNICNWKIIR